MGKKEPIYVLIASRKRRNCKPQIFSLRVQEHSDDAISYSLDCQLFAFNSSACGNRYKSCNTFYAQLNNHFFVANFKELSKGFQENSYRFISRTYSLRLLNLLQIR